MIIGDVMILIKTLKDLAEQKGKLDKAYFENFVQPIWEAFIKVHEDYKESFREYARLVSEENIEVEVLLQRIREDSMYTADLRSELGKLMQYIPSSPLSVKEHYINDFIQSLQRYFAVEISTNKSRKTVGFAMEYLDQVPTNLPRYKTIIHLSKMQNRMMGEESNLEIGKAMEIFEGMINYLQDAYEQVAGAYYMVRQKLLT